MSERWLFVRWQSVFVKQPSNDNVAWWLWYVLLRNMPWWWGGCRDDVLYLWLNDCCRCSVKLLWMELFVVFSTMLLSNYFCLLLVWVVMEMVLYWFVPTWLYAVVSGDVAVVLRMLQCPLSSRCGWCRCTWGWLRGDIAVVVWTNVCCHVLLLMWSDVVVDGIVLMCRHSGGMRWCVAVVVEVGVCAALPSWWFMMMLIHGVDCCDCWSIYRRRENLITEELNFVGKRAKETSLPTVACLRPHGDVWWCCYAGVDCCDFWFDVFVRLILTYCYILDLVWVRKKLIQNELFFVVTGKQHYRHPWPWFASDLHALIDCVDYRFRHVRLECRP